VKRSRRPSTEADSFRRLRPTAAERRQRSKAVDSYKSVQGWLDLTGTVVGLCQECAACVPRADLTVSSGLVVCRACASLR
jgi:formylmethanofuran dehydrogenase subunit E